MRSHLPALRDLCVGQIGYKMLSTNRQVALVSVAFCISLCSFFASPVCGQAADSLLVNGKILTVDSQFSIREALAISDGNILAVGKTADIRKLGGPASRIIDLQGRTVIPGLIDSHLHGIRAGLSFTTEVNWVGATSLDEAMSRIRQAARTMKP